MLKSILQTGAVFALFATVLFTACQKEDLVVSEDNFTLGDPLLGQAHEALVIPAVVVLSLFSQSV